MIEAGALTPMGPRLGQQLRFGWALGSAALSAGSGPLWAFVGSFAVDSQKA